MKAPLIFMTMPSPVKVRDEGLEMVIVDHSQGIEGVIGNQLPAIIDRARHGMPPWLSTRTKLMTIEPRPSSFAGNRWCS
ncbi:hypothetical protein [Desulfobulbus sp.]|uniref:hypothetical protein n=1 Tax=Desulfobulbus sp. TaxID=895 RepID=UPI00286F71B3|nr:hypothetical protein [Desulfobulbus sp.]